MTEQEEEIRGLLDSLRKLPKQRGPLTEEEIQKFPSNISVGGWTISKDSVTGFLDNQGILIHQLANSLPNDVHAAVCTDIGELIVGVIDGISRISTLCNSQNKPIEDNFPSVLLSFLAKLRGRTLYHCLIDTEIVSLVV